MSPELLTAIGGLLLAIVAVANSVFTRRKIDKELAIAKEKLAIEKPLIRSQETRNIGQTYGELVDNLQEQVRDGQEQIKEVKDENELLRNKMTEMRLEFELKLSQAFERISVLEEENAILRGSKQEQESF